MERDFRFNWTLLVEEAARRRRSLNLTQQQLAALAKVSTPTVSRFEQGEKNVQLSSMLAILEVLGMTDKRTLTFVDPDYHLDGEGVTFWGEDGSGRVPCRISREALEDHFSDRDSLPAGWAFEKHHSEIQALARRKYLLDQREPDGSILIKTGDLA